MEFSEVKKKILHSIIIEFLEYCFKSAEVDLDPSYFYGNEHKIIKEFLDKREKDDNEEMYD